MENNNLVQQLYLNPSSRAYAIQVKYADCVGCTPGGIERGSEGSISSYSSRLCPLYRSPPYQQEMTLEGKNTAVRA